jgi:hypothetical protein
MNYNKKTIKLLNIIFNLLRETNILNKKDYNIYSSLISEESHSFGLDIYTKPIDNLIFKLDELIQGDDFTYCLYDLNILERDNKKTSRYQIKTTKGKKYHIFSKESAIDYIYYECILPEIKKHSIDNDNCLENSTLYFDSLLLKLLFNFYEDSIIESNKFIETILHFFYSTNSSNILENSQVSNNLENNLITPIFNLLSIKSKDILYAIIDNNFKDGLFPFDLTIGEIIIEKKDVFSYLLLDIE